MDKKFSALTAAILLATSSYAMAEDDELGFSGQVGLGMGIFTQEDNLSTDGDETISQYGSASSESEFTVEPIVNLEYAFNEKHYVYGGTHNEELIQGELAFELGYGYKMDNGTVLDVSYVHALMADEVWENPYELNSKRETTDLSANGFRFQAEEIAGTGFGFDGIYYSKDVDNEASIKELERSGSGFNGAVSYTYYLDGQSALIPSVNYGSYSADGDAESFSEYGFGIEYMRQAGNHAFILGFEYDIRDFDEANPIAEFDGKTREDSGYALQAMYQYEEFMGWEDWTFIGVAGYESSDSNIDFYDASEYQVIAAMTYSF
ncbi:DUF2860 family protein [Vibrio maerlii]|uniref:DUF2860 family protein n=1 Tax=Vibrio maerlii TaxID=2231648 RepID=UPI0013DE8D47|nr:DUF2860 family protein [Vibrio maerlii]